MVVVPGTKKDRSGRERTVLRRQEREPRITRMARIRRRPVATSMPFVRPRFLLSYPCYPCNPWLSFFPAGVIPVQGHDRLIQSGGETGQRSEFAAPGRVPSDQGTCAGRRGSVRSRPPDREEGAAGPLPARQPPLSDPARSAAAILGLSGPMKGSNGRERSRHAGLCRVTCSLFPGGDGLLCRRNLLGNRRL